MVKEIIEETGQVQHENETEIIRSARDGDSVAFNKVVYLYQKRIFKLGFGFFRDREDAMEIVQETFLKVFENFCRFREGTHFGSWLYRIATNLCIDRYRKMKGKLHGEVDWERFSYPDSDKWANPEELTMREGFQDSLKKSLVSLSKRQRAVFVLKHDSNMKYREIADVLKVSVGTVKSLHHRAIHKIKTCLSEGESKNG